MSLVAKQGYVKVIREVSDNKQKYIEIEKHLYLYETMINTSSGHFKLTDVLDISYRNTTEKYGTLYLHTNQGVFAYVVKTDPINFIKMFKKLTANQ